MSRQGRGTMTRPYGVSEQIMVTAVQEQLRSGSAVPEIIAALDQVIAQCTQTNVLLGDLAVNSSRLPMGHLLHRLLRRLVRRQIEPLSRSILILSESVSDLSHQLKKSIDFHESESRTRLYSLQDTVVQRIAVLDVIEARMRHIEKYFDSIE
jgi:hypothetical protein